MSLELFEQVQHRLTKKVAPKYNKHNPLFKNMITCSECTGTVTWETQKGHWYGHCNHYRQCGQKGYTRAEEIEKHLLEQLARLVSPSQDIIAWVKGSLRAKYQTDMEKQQSLKKQLEERHKDLGRRDDLLYDDRLDSRITAYQYDQKHQEIVNERELIATKLETLDSDYLSALERGINILELSQNAAAIYKSKNDAELRVLLRDLFSNLRL